MTGFNPSLLGTIAACYRSVLVHFNGAVIKEDRVDGLRVSLRLNLTVSLRLNLTVAPVRLFGT